MTTAKVFVCAFMILFVLKAEAQSNEKSRGLLQQEFISKHFIEPHFRNGANFEITSTEMMDSLFKAIDRGWTKAATDTLAKYKLNMPLDDFKHIDAYCYLWTILSMSQNLDLSAIHKRHLVRQYLIPAMNNDLHTLKRRPNLTSLQLVHSGTLQNTLVLGSDSDMDKKTILSIYNLYTSFDATLKAFAKNPDTAISNYAKSQVQDLERFKYDLNAKSNYHNGNEDASLNYVLTGLSTNDYPRSRVFSMAELLLNKFAESRKNNSSLKLLDALMTTTTSDNISRDTLLHWYIKVDSLNGQSLFNTAMSRIPKSSFIKTSKTITLPKPWNFITKSVDPEKIATTKYYLLDVWYTSCGPCILEVPELNAFSAKFKDRTDVQFISINTDFINGNFDKRYVSERIKDLKIKFPVVYDDANSKIASGLSVKSFPEKFIIDSTGNIIVKADNSPMTLKAFELFIQELESTN